MSQDTSTSTTKELQDEVTLYHARAKGQEAPTKASYGIDSPAGLISSAVFAPLYLYATMKGKFDLWQGLLESTLSCARPGHSEPAKDLNSPTLDAGCGRGLVLIKTAQIRARLAKSQNVSPTKSVGIDLFITSDQTGNSVDATCSNLAAESVLKNTQLYKASFMELPFEDATFGLVTSSLALHNPKTKELRYAALREVCRVLKPGGTLIVFDLGGYVRHFRNHLKEVMGWIQANMEWSGLGTNFGSWPAYVLVAKKPYA